jgi:hypothetical protein
MTRTEQAAQLTQHQGERAMRTATTHPTFALDPQVEQALEPAAPATFMGISLPCPRCLEPKAQLSLNLGTCEVHCEECGEEFTLGDVREIVGRWGAALRWLDSVNDYLPQA